MADNNSDKSIHGKNGLDNLEKMICFSKDKDYIVDYKSEYREGYLGYNSKQFYYPFLIEFKNHEYWILHSTTSVRSDRLNIPQWHAEHLKQINKHIKRAYVIYPSGLPSKEKNNAVREQLKITEHRNYSAIDGVVSQNELYSLIEQHALSLSENMGQARANRGIAFEAWLVSIINNSDNYQKWKTDDSKITGYFYDTFLLFVDSMGLVKNQISRIDATNEVPVLPSGGKAKADIIVTVMSENKKSIFTFSCKKTEGQWVSAHEYSAEKYIEVLNIKDQILIEAINEFQAVGGINKLKPLALEAMEKRLSAYNTKLNHWVLGGVGGAGDPEVQWAQKIVTYSDSTGQISIMGIDDYIEQITKEGIPGQFGTCFKWTYPSGGLGKKIQLKMKV